MGLNLINVALCSSFLDNLSNSYNLVKGITKGFLTEEYTLNTISYDMCRDENGNVKDEHMLFRTPFNFETLKTPKLYQKDEKLLFPVEATIFNDIILT